MFFVLCSVVLSKVIKPRDLTTAATCYIKIFFPFTFSRRVLLNIFHRNIFIMPLEVTQFHKRNSKAYMLPRWAEALPVTFRRRLVPSLNGNLSCLTITQEVAGSESGYKLSLGNVRVIFRNVQKILCSLKLTVFLELRSSKTVRFSEQIIRIQIRSNSRASILSRQMEAINYLFN